MADAITIKNELSGFLTLRSIRLITNPLASADEMLTLAPFPFVLGEEGVLAGAGADGLVEVVARPDSMSDHTHIHSADVLNS
jgi:hypothetical protein